MKPNIIKVLSILSFVILMDNFSYVYAITQVLLLTLCTHRLINNRIIERSRAIWSLGLIIIFLADIIIAQKLP